jgi:hypothetical protein
VALVATRERSRSLPFSTNRHRLAEQFRAGTLAGARRDHTDWLSVEKELRNGEWFDLPQPLSIRAP